MEQKSQSDIKHFYIEKGIGEPLILLHGNAENCTYFEKQLQEFSSYYRVIAIDTRGHGKTPRGNKPFTIRQFSDDLLDFFLQTKIESANILGFSDGANIAMCFAAKYPSRVKKLILNSGNLGTWGIKASVQIPIEIGFRVARLFSEKSKTARDNAQMLGLMINQPNVTVEELNNITAETLVIAGTNDVVKKKHSEYIADNIKKAQIVFLSGNHYIANKNSVEFNRTVKAFLSDKHDD